MNPEQWLVVGLALFFASMLQSTVGFGFSLFVVPLLLLQDFTLVNAVTIGIVGSTAHRIMAVTHMRRAVDWRTLLPMMLVGLLALPLGLTLMYYVSSLEQIRAKQIIGLCILLLLLLQWFGRVEPHKAIHKAWGYLAAFSSGVLNGLANIGGPPIILWILAHRWSNEKFRVTTLAFSLIFFPFQILLMLTVFGTTILVTAEKCLLLIPLTLLGGWLGLKIGQQLQVIHLRWIARVLLVLIAVFSIIKPFF